MFPAIPCPIARQWSPQRKRLHAHHLDDPNHPIAVTARANPSKGARGPDRWSGRRQSLLIMILYTLLCGGQRGLRWRELWVLDPRSMCCNSLMRWGIFMTNMWPPPTVFTHPETSPIRLPARWLTPATLMTRVLGQSMAERCRRAIRSLPPGSQAPVSKTLPG